MTEIIFISMGTLCVSVALLVFFFVIGTYLLDRHGDG
jgi:hypothetical protein